MTNSTDWKAKPYRPEYDIMRERLISAGWDLICKAGVKRLTLNAVASEANCARSSVYRYFDSKEQLLGAILQDQIYELGVKVDKTISEFTDPKEQLVQGLYLSVCEIKAGPMYQMFSHLGSEEGREISDVLQSSLPQIASEILKIDPLFVKAREEGQVRDELSDQDIFRWMILVGSAVLQVSDFGKRPKEELGYLRKMLIPSIFKI